MQCSNCATTWFQPGRRSEPLHTDQGDEASLQDDATSGPVADDFEETPQGLTDTPLPDTEPDTAFAAWNAPDANDWETAQDDLEQYDDEQDGPDPLEVAAAATVAAAGTAVAGAQAGRPPIDDTVKDILRSEAAREAELRRGESEPVETQSEMPLDDQDRPVAEQADLDDAQNAYDVYDADTGTEIGGTRRDLLPDIDELNSTLRDTSDRTAAEADATDIDTVEALPQRRRGVRVGFFLTLLVAAACVVVYLNAAQLIEAVPALSDGISVFVAMIDNGRVWLDNLARSLAAAGPGADG